MLRFARVHLLPCLYNRLNQKVDRAERTGSEVQSPLAFLPLSRLTDQSPLSLCIMTEVLQAVIGTPITAHAFNHDRTRELQLACAPRPSHAADLHSFS